MMNDNHLSDEEVQREEARTEIGQLYHELELKVEDPELVDRIEVQRRITGQALRQTQMWQRMTGAAFEELGKYFNVLAEVQNRVKGSEIDNKIEELFVIQVKIQVSISKLHYESGRRDSAISTLWDEDKNTTLGTEYMQDVSPRHKELHERLNRLVDLLCHTFEQ